MVKERVNTGGLVTFEGDTKNESSGYSDSVIRFREAYEKHLERKKRNKKLTLIITIIAIVVIIGIITLRSILLK
jgi:hypothetical protein